ncbi:MAG: hypothetical protein JSR46_04895 [Verrucomicrobia bacterium]|nr:hypothetical protein [Verrucomicrobiota bacterium]
MRIACVDKTHMGIIRLTRYYPIIIDAVLQKIWGAYIEKKSEYEKIDKTLNELNISLDEVYRKFSFGLFVFVGFCPSSISNRLQHFFPSIREASQAMDGYDEANRLSVHSQLLKDEVQALRPQFCHAREDARIMELFGGRQKYEQLPELFADAGVFEESFTLFRDTYLKKLQGLLTRDGKLLEAPLNIDRCLFLFAVSLEVCWMAGHKFTDREDWFDTRSFAAPFFETAPDLLPKALEKLKEIEISKKSPLEVFSILSKEYITAPIMRVPEQLAEGSLSHAFIVSLKDTTTNENHWFLLCRIGGRSWCMHCDVDITILEDVFYSILVNDTGRSWEDFSLFTEKGEKKEGYNQLSEILLKKEGTFKDKTFKVSL